MPYILTITVLVAFSISQLIPRILSMFYYETVPYRKTKENRRPSKTEGINE